MTKFRAPLEFRADIRKLKARPRPQEQDAKATDFVRKRDGGGARG